MEIETIERKRRNEMRKKKKIFLPFKSIGVNGKGYKAKFQRYEGEFERKRKNSWVLIIGFLMAPNPFGIDTLTDDC